MSSDLNSPRNGTHAAGQRMGANGANSTALATYRRGQLRSIAWIVLGGTLVLVSAHTARPADLSNQAIDGRAARAYTDKNQAPLNAQELGVRCDGTNEMAAIALAISRASQSAGAVLQFPPGTCAFSETSPGLGLSFNQVVSIRGAGREKTTLKNLSATGAGIRLVTGYQSLSDLTIDQNGSTGRALQLHGQHSVVRDVRIINQAGASTYAFVIDGATLSDIENVTIVGTNGLDIGPTRPTNYLNLRQVTVVNTFGKAVRINTGSNIKFFGLYVDPGDAANRVEESISITNSSNIDFYSLAAELAGPAMLAPSAYFRIDGSRSVNFWGGRISHTATATRTLFSVTGYGSGNINFEGLELISTKAGMTLFDFNAAGLALASVRNVRTVLTSPAIGVKTTALVSRLRIENYHDSNNVSSHTLDSTDLFVLNVAGAIALQSRDRQVLVNVSDPVTVKGPDSYTLIPEPFELVTSAGDLNVRGATRLAAAGGSFAVTLRDSGIIGAIKTIVLGQGSGSVRLAVTHHETASPQAFVFDNPGDTLVLQWSGYRWMTLKNLGVSIR